MKATGFVRKIDALGRLTLPSELREKLDIGSRDGLEIFVDDKYILLKKYEPCDVFTGEMEDLIDFEGKKVSMRSLRRMMAIAGLEEAAK